MFASIQGRSSDVIQFSDGSFLATPTAQLIFGKQPWFDYVVEQIELDAIAIKYVPIDKSRTEHSELLSKLQRLCGPNVRIVITNVKEIEPGTLGKRQYFIPLKS